MEICQMCTRTPSILICIKIHASMTMPSLHLTCSMGWSQWTVQWTRPLQSFSAAANAQASAVQHPLMRPRLTVVRQRYPERQERPKRQSRQGRIKNLLASHHVCADNGASSHRETKSRITIVVSVVPSVMSLPRRSS